MISKEGRVRYLTFSELTPSFLSKLENHLSTLRNEREPDKKLHPNTIEFILNIFKTIVKRAIEIDRLMKYEKNQSLIYSYKGVKTLTEKLNEDEIELLANLKLEEDSLQN